jgi:dTMP kinase
MLITFEGLKGCKKEVYMNELADMLRRSRFPEVYCTKEPGFPDSPISRLMSHLINNEPSTMPVEKLFLLLADRAAHYEKFVGPIINRKRETAFSGGYVPPSTPGIVLSDRGPDSLIAYQGFGYQIAPIELLMAMNSLALRNTPIHLTFIIDIPEYESDPHGDQEFLKRVRQGYKHIAQMSPGRVFVVDGTMSVEKNKEFIWRTVAPALGINAQ